LSIKNDETFGVKVPLDLKEKAQTVVKNSGLTGKEWLEKALALMDVNSIKDGMLDHREDLNELELHTTRIYELTTNMIKRNSYIKDNAVKEVQQKLEDKESQLSELKEKLIKLKESYEKIEKENRLLIEEQKNTKILLEQHVKTDERNQELFEEYKAKIQTLSGLVTEYKNYQEENSKLSKEINTIKEMSNSTISELRVENQELQKTNKRLLNEMDKFKKEFEIELDRLNDKKEIEKERAVLSLTQGHQEALSKINNDFTSKIKESYEEKEKLRNLFELNLESEKKNHRKELQQINHQYEEKLTILLQEKEKLEKKLNQNKEIQ
jgi:hypothetical protein